METIVARQTPELRASLAEIHARLVKETNQPDRELFYTPIHVSSAKNPSITLRPLYRGPRKVTAPERTCELADGKVLISILIGEKTAIPDVNPIANIKVEAVFESNSNSSLCRVTMPVAVWDMLKRSEAYSFVAYAESHNLLLDQPGPSSVLESRAGNVQLPAKEK
ncbi:hypothetical protein P168DRAFT_278414 [Aspergillus campestris IBT 28561]|uniref:Uncharacterized protein n=1 Tax=Aspergillus campestris (strain IBT 28561) TaxID=1392248 RepID=A0A2I1DG69_ASPC2|nr:uncharacterized protein P168DRAFT_278414 [Aspergillus campestris IBT 28561]PKY08866.1 hypothetical protein P168DRAFT_278414 [Aspergillus campestris IBT 28561]